MSKFTVWCFVAMPGTVYEWDKEVLQVVDSLEAGQDWVEKNMKFASQSFYKTIRGHWVNADDIRTIYVEEIEQEAK